ncbi:MAG: PQQ-binding-like beta-propeller repeat protein [Planctomycetaceae bacterium]
MLRTYAVAAVFALPFLRTPPVDAAAVPTPDRNPAGIERAFGVQRGIIAFIGLPSPADGLVRIAKSGRYTIYFQSGHSKEVAAVRKAADAAGLLGKRIFVHGGSPKTIHLANNIADGVLISPSAAKDCTASEVLRALRPRAIGYLAGRKLVKPVPKGIDEWTHPYHAPDNNPQSRDKQVRGEFRTQFIAEPKFSPMPEQTVIAGGRIFKAMGHIAHKQNQNAMLNTLLCINAYNGTILWKRPLPKGFMIHRNTMIATHDALYMGDHDSCKVIDAVTGKVRRQFTVPKKITDGPTWKWMGVDDDILYALVGNREIKVDTRRSARRGLGHWPWGMWQGHDYKDPRTAFGFGRTLVALDRKTGKVIWHHREKDFLDARAVCMSGERLYFYSPEKFLGCLSTATGSVLWKTKDKDLLKAIGPNGRAQNPRLGYATACYIKARGDQIFFAGPQRKTLVVVSGKDGKLQWTHPVGNLQLVLRDDAVFGAGPQSKNGVKLDYKTGKSLGTFIGRRACTRATGCADSIFFRATGGTVRLLTETDTETHIAPMRPPCQDGVIVSNGHLYWGPWMCGCQLSLYGNIALAPAKTALSDDPYRNALTTHGDVAKVLPLDVRNGDWTSYRGGNDRVDTARIELPGKVKLAWNADVTVGELPTAPVTAGGMVFIADRTGAVRAFDKRGKPVWKAYTGGPVYYPPAVAGGRVFVGSADGRVYAFEAKTGRRLWSFRAAPQERVIPVYGKLISRWPVAGGVVVHDGRVYAAAGIAHYDGTYVVSLDAVTGQLKARNTVSGKLSEAVNSGISIQGVLTVVDGELRFLGGGVYETARYDLKTLKCLNAPNTKVRSRYRTAFYPYYPGYGKYVSLLHTCGDGNILCHDASYEGNYFGSLKLQPPLKPGQRIVKDAARDFLRRRGRKVPKTIWRDTTGRRFTGFIVGKTQLVAAGQVGVKSDTAFLAAITIKDGGNAWRHKLPALPVKGGVALGHDGRIYVALENGRLMCFAPGESSR